MEKPPPPAPTVSPQVREWKHRALDLLHRGELAEALTAWKVLRALDPENPEYPRQIDATRALIHHRAEQHLRAGDAAFVAGERERAEIEYLKALALDPWITEPLPRLREIDRERALAEENERLAKILARRRQRNKKKGRTTAGSNSGQQERDYLETGIALFKQGKYEESILEIQKYLHSFPDDAEARRYLMEARRKLATPTRAPRARPGAASEGASAPPPAPKRAPNEGRNTPREEGRNKRVDHAAAKEFYDKGLRAFRTNIAQAIRYWEQALRYDPGYTQARLRLERGRRMLRNLEQISKE